MRERRIGEIGRARSDDEKVVYFPEPARYPMTSRLPPRPTVTAFVVLVEPSSAVACDHVQPRRIAIDVLGENTTPTETIG